MVHLELRIFRKFSEKCEISRGKVIHEKNGSKKSRGTVQQDGSHKKWYQSIGLPGMVMRWGF
jgi:hypothetical protein